MVSGFVVKVFGVSRPLMVLFKGDWAGCGRLMVVSVCVIEDGGVC